MNRYQREVAEMDRRHRVTVRALSFGGACCLAVLALWSAGLPPTQWVAAAQRLWERMSGPPTATLTTATRSTAPDPAPASVTSPSLTAQQGTDASASTTPLPLYLVATTPGRNKHEGTARIGTSLDNPQTYAGGALLANGSRLSEIHTDRVVLSRDGASAELYIHGRGAHAKQRQSADALLTIATQPTAAPAVVEKVSEGLTDYLRPSPVYDGEMLRGYQVYPGSRPAVFGRLGLEPGDVVTSINDAPLNEPSQSMELFAQLMRGVAVVATVERKGAAHRITINGAVISADRATTQETTERPVPPYVRGERDVSAKRCAEQRNWG